jgi:hypothetical protein
MDFLCLLLDPADGARIACAGAERVPFGERNLFADSQGKLFDRMKINKFGLGGPPGRAATLLSESEQILAAAGIILRRFDGDTSSGKVSRLIERWINALHWYGQALREPSDFMAIVKYGCAIDILTNGEGNLNKIASCAAKAFGCDKDSAITRDGRKLIDIVNAVFNEGALGACTRDGIRSSR